MHMLQHLATALIQRRAALRHIAQGQRTVTAQIDVIDLNIWFEITQVVLRRELLDRNPPRGSSL